MKVFCSAYAHHYLSIHVSKVPKSINDTLTGTFYFYKQENITKQHKLFFFLMYYSNTNNLQLKLY